MIVRAAHRETMSSLLFEIATGLCHSSSSYSNAAGFKLMISVNRNSLSDHG